MARSVLRLADQLVSRLVPRAEASAATQTKCVCCASTYSKICYRDCISAVCEPWGCRACNTC
ncbi:MULTISPECIES: hypothetical protein [Thermomonosporaceae]|uniref:hypothetical protein n=1 Tax=Thermomonosporaceae TaxID=2012 RepID=UPI00255B381F|nr:MULTISPECIES: hypothetical protein [Thermomonosporaceae]MDL4772524.1 hypothetical protein [Actinomadura xylanilytica]